MSHYVCPKCQHKAYLFGQDGARDVAKEMDIELLGTIVYVAEYVQGSYWDKVSPWS